MTELRPKIRWSNYDVLFRSVFPPDFNMNALFSIYKRDEMSDKDSSNEAPTDFGMYSMEYCIILGTKLFSTLLRTMRLQTVCALNLS
jgi:hypothetical protein